MQVEKKELENSELELTIEVSLAELQPHLEKAAEHLSTEIKFEGFRPGKAPYDMVKAKVGEQAIYEEAINSVVSKTYFQAMQENNLQTVGQPDIQVVKMAPGNPLIYKATVGILPTLTLPDLAKIKIAKRPVEVADEEINKIIDEVREARVKEVAVTRELKNNDKAEISITIKRDGVVIEGGNVPKYPIILGKSNFIPGFEDNLIGLKTNDEKTFKLNFPENYFEKSLAGQEAEFSVKILNVFERQLPELNDQFASDLHEDFKTLVDLKNKIKENLTTEKQVKEDQRAEQEMLEKIIEQTKFSGIPSTLVKHEKHLMLHELEDAIEHEGMNMDDYLKHIKKTKEEVEKELEPQAIKRVKISLILRDIGEKEKLVPTEDEIEKEVANTIKLYPNNPEVEKQIAKPEYKEYLKTILRNRKAIEFIKQSAQITS